MKKLIRVFKNNYLIIVIFIFGLFLRLLGLNWDDGQHLHPDERFLTMVSSSIRLPESVYSYFDTSTSPLNPANTDFEFYVYGTLPLLLTRSVAEIFHMTDYSTIYLVGRVLSAILDTGVAIIIFFIAKEIFKNITWSIIASFFYTTAFLPIQQAHFFTVDSFTVFFSTFTLYFIIRHINKPSINNIVFSGLFFGLTLSSKTSIGIVLPIILLFINLDSLIHFFTNKNKVQYIKRIILVSAEFLITTVIIFRIFQPYAFNGLVSVSPLFKNNISLAHKMITGEYDYPPNVQWFKTVPLVHPLVNIFLFGLGPIIFFTSFLGILFLFFKRNKNKIVLYFLLSFAALIFFYQGIQLAKYMRYFYPIYPVLCIFSAYLFSVMFKDRKIAGNKIVVGLLLAQIIWVVLFLHIYMVPNSRVEASKWICQNIPPHSTLTSEYWDDALPLFIRDCIGNSYQNISLAIYDTDTSDKWKKLLSQIKQADYIIMSSNRLWGSIPKNPERYPISSEFYKTLFDNGLEFTKVAEFSSYPGLEIPFMTGCLYLGPSNIPTHANVNRLVEYTKSCSHPGIYLRDDTSEESFTVYDHPKVYIFKSNYGKN